MVSVWFLNVNLLHFLGLHVERVEFFLTKSENTLCPCSLVAGIEGDSPFLSQSGLFVSKPRKGSPWRGISSLFQCLRWGTSGASENGLTMTRDEEQTGDKLFTGFRCSLDTAASTSLQTNSSILFSLFPTLFPTP